MWCEWQTPADRKAFTERTDCEVKEYGSFEAVPGVKLNGNLTLGENTADNGGLRLAYLALMDTLAKEAPEHRAADRWLHSRAALLPRLWPGVVRERARAVGAQQCPDRPAFPGQMAGERRGAELR